MSRDRLKEALKIGNFGYWLLQSFDQIALREYEWLLIVQDALNGKQALEMSFEDRTRMVAEEAGAHLQEVVATLRPYYQRRACLKEELERQDARIVVERSAEVGWEAELREVKAEWSRIEALVEAQDLSLEQLNSLTIYRRRLLDRKEEASLNLSSCRQELAGASSLRDKLESSLGQVNSQILVYELRERELADFKRGVGIDYKLGTEKKGLSDPAVLDAQSQVMNVAREAEGSLAVEDGLDWDVLGIYSEKDKSESRRTQSDFDKGIADWLDREQGGSLSKRP